MKYELPRATGNSILDSFLRRHIETLNASEAEILRKLISLEKLNKNVEKLEKSIEAQKTILGNQEKLLLQIKEEIEANRELLAAAESDIKILGSDLPMPPFALQMALAKAGETIEWIR